MGALRARGVEITLIARQWDAGVADVRPLACDPFYLGRWWRDAGFARGVARLLERHPFHLVQTHERIAGCDLYRAGDGVHREWLRQRGRVQSPLGRWLAGLNPYHRYLLSAERRLFEDVRLKAVICNSNMVREEILEAFAIDPGKLHVIYSGVDCHRFHPDARREHREPVRRAWGIGADDLLLLFVGSGFRRKGVPVLLEAMTRLPDHCKLLIVGRDKERKGMERLARRLGLEGRVRFAGGRSEVIPFYGAADGVVLPTLYDPFPNVALEAMAMGLPLVTTFKCGAVDWIESGRNGLLSDALDVEALTANLLSLLDRPRREAMGEAARATVVPMTLEAMSGRLLTLYETLLR
ncbi:MAG: glycosyltransferase family 4 protein [Magnetococcales bacterium]|nr:glycosyltransferase family 4 protein [Magnetococcales bacterium]